ncbi:MAG: formiminoglutamate deiminase [Flavobacteriales bacterium]|jgi:formiminoglutamate deiminase
MKRYTFNAILQNEGWLDNVSIDVDESGEISSISQNQESKGEVIQGYAIPGFQNAHSHAFQYAMAGRGELHKKGASGDDFWSWRQQMYALALSVSPDELRTIAFDLYSQMKANGYTQVAEFHYLHHDKEGNRYGNEAEMGEALIQAAQQAGIKITLVPIFYQKGGFGTEPTLNQRRFISATVEDYQRLLSSSQEAAKKYDNANVAIGIHSMRGVEPTDIVRVANELDQNVPFHIHVSEQLKEIEDALSYLNQRPVEWMLNNVELTERYHLVHATHLVGSEVDGVSGSGANVVLCPSTEGNLGDGLFPLKDFQNKGGNWSIGTDSHVGLNPMEELRIIDYGQRLITHRRDTFGGYDFEDSGQYALNQITTAGRKAMNNFESQYFKIGADFDACIIKSDAPTLKDCPKENRASVIVYTTDQSMVLRTFVKGV